MKRIKRASIVLIAVGLVIALTMVIPASAQSGKGDVKVLDSEFVVATLDYGGEIEEVQVFDQLSVDGEGTVTVKEEAAFEDIGGYQAVKGFAKPKVEGDFIVWPEIDVDGPANIIANTKLSESNVEEAKTRIPLDVRFKYWFDGEPVSDLSTITGKSGRFKMELELTNTSKEMKEITYEDANGEMVTEKVEVYLPLVILPYDWYFDNSVFFNLEADPTGLVVYMPDLYNVGWSIPLFPPATDESHTIWVAADVKNFQMAPLTLAVAFTFPETNQADAFAILGPALVQIYDGMKQVNDGIGAPETPDTLLYGITAVDDGLSQLGAGLPGATTSINTAMIPGVEQMAAGIGSASTPDTLLYADSAAIAGLQGISAGIGAATTDGTLLYAMNAMAEGFATTLGYIGSSTTPGTLMYAAYAVINGLAGLRAALGPGGTIQNYVNWLYADLNWSYPAHDPYGQPSLLFLIQNLGLTGPQQAALTGIITGIYNPVLSGINTGLTGIANNSIGDGTSPTSLSYAANAIYGGLAGIAGGIGSATTPDTLMYAVDQVTKGLTAMKAGIGSAASSGTLLYALAAMQGGLASIKAGLSSGNMNDPGIKEGLVLLSTGLQEAVTGIGSAGTPDTLLYGTGQIKGGLTDLGGGATQLVDGMDMLVSTLNMTDAELEAIAQRGEEFDHFLGRAEGEENNVRFVYQTKATYNYETGSKTSWIVAIVLSVIIALGLAAGGLMLARRSTA